MYGGTYALEQQSFKKPAYLYEIDFMRLFFILGVLFNHVINQFTANMVSDPTNTEYKLLSVSLIVHFTRMGFMFMTGVVLTLNYYHRHDWLTFYRKRFNGSIWPYLIWNALLLVVTIIVGETTQNTKSIFSWSGFGQQFVNIILHGSNFYMYYMLIIMQLYLIFPALMWLFHHWSTYHKRILIISFFIQLVELIIAKYVLPHVDTSNWIYWIKNYDINVFSYQFYFIFGTFTILHYHEITDWISKQIKFLLPTTILAAIGTVVYFCWYDRIVLGLTEGRSVSPHQPYTLIYAILVIVIILWVGQHYAMWYKNGMPKWLSSVVKNGARVSFGMYLDQTIGLLILDETLQHIHVSNTTMLFLIPLGYAFVVATSFVIAWFCYKVRPFGFLIGRPNWHPFKRAKKSKSSIKTTAKIGYDINTR